MLWMLAMLTGCLLPFPGDGCDRGVATMTLDERNSEGIAAADFIPWLEGDHEIVVQWTDTTGASDAWTLSVEVDTEGITTNEVTASDGCEASRGDISVPVTLTLFDADGVQQESFDDTVLLYETDPRFLSVDGVVSSEALLGGHHSEDTESAGLDYWFRALFDADGTFGSIEAEVPFDNVRTTFVEIATYSEGLD